jgi:hypothetical protein
MAGAGFKVYATGDLITATEFNTFIQEQVVMVFADSTARDSAVSSPSEGMFCFLKDTDTLQFYSGSTWSSYIGDGDITGVTVTTASNSGLAGGSASTSGAFSATLVVDPSNLADGSSVTVDTANDLLILEDVTDGTVYKVKPSQIASGSANALEDGDSDFTITDGVANGIHYELDNTDMANWNEAGIQLLTAGGIFRHNQTIAPTFTIASGEGAVLAGPVSVTGTITVTGTMVVI